MYGVASARAAAELESRVLKTAAESPAMQLELESEQLRLGLKALLLRLENLTPLLLPASATYLAAELRADCLNRQV